MKTKNSLRILFAATVIISGSFLFTRPADAKIPVNARNSKSQTNTYLGDYIITVNGINTDFQIYGDLSTNYITEVYDYTDGVWATVTMNLWTFYTSPAYGCRKVEFDVTINGVRYPEAPGGNFVE